MYFDGVEVPLYDLYLQNITLRTGLIQARAEMPAVLDAIASGALDPTAVVDRVLDWHPPHQAAGRKLYAHAKQTERLAERDQHLLAGQHPGEADGRYQAAYRYAQRWGLAAPPAIRHLSGSRAAGASMEKPMGQSVDASSITVKDAP